MNVVRGADNGRNIFRSPLAAALAVGLLVVAVVESGAVSVDARVDGGSVTEVQVTGRAGIPADAVAVSVNLAAVNPITAGYLSAFPCGDSTPTDSSTVNHDVGNATSNSAIVKIGTGGKICVYSMSPADIIVDVTGWFAPSSGYTSLAPVRFLDTRTTSRIAAGTTREVQISGRSGIPGNVAAVAIDLVAVDPAAAGYLSAYPCGGTAPTGASTVNYDTSYATSNSAIVKVGSGGKICVYSMSTVDIVVDITGWFASGSGYTSLDPVRFLDTRTAQRLGAASTREVQIAGRSGIPTNATAATINLAAIAPSAAGYLSAFPCGGTTPTSASTVNYDTSYATSNSAIVKIGVGGKICVYSMSAADVVVDVTGWFTGNGYTAVDPSRLLDTRTASPSGGPTPPGATAPPAATPSVPAGGFVETFTGNTGLDRFDYGVYHRDDVLVAQTQWSGDHDQNCGSPDTQRTIHRNAPSESFYMCVDHLMTSVGDTSGYSIAWFSPKQVFHGGKQTQVSFDVNVTNLGARKWWEVSIVPVGSPFLATVDWVAKTAQIATYDSQSVVLGTGPYGNDGNIVTQGVSRDPLGWGHVCGSDGVDPEGCASKAIRRTFTVTDNLNGTITFDFLGERYTYAGKFPSDFRVYFKDHSYTPLKDGPIAGMTWHWDNIVVR